MNARTTEVPYALRLRSRKLADDLRKIAKAERRSLNEIINIACERFVSEALKTDKEKA